MYVIKMKVPRTYAHTHTSAQASEQAWYPYVRNVPFMYAAGNKHHLAFDICTANILVSLYEHSQVVSPVVNHCTYGLNLSLSICLCVSTTTTTKSNSSSNDHDLAMDIALVHLK